MIIPAYIAKDNNRPPLTIVSTSDWHTGRIDLSYQYNILKEQMIQPLYQVHFDIFVIAGDFFDHKEMANSEAVMYGCLIFKEVVELCRSKGATLLIIEGTKEHDNGQLKLFYSYLSDPTIDIRIVEQARFEYIKGIRVLCLPEEYSKPEEYYDQLLHRSGLYDIAVVHGMYKGAVYQEKVITIDESNTRNKIFTIDDFDCCRGYIIAGHIHTSGCFDKYFYYCGTPYRWMFGEENPKGFLISFYNPNTHEHYCHFQQIECHRYITLNLDDMIDHSPDEIIYYVNLLLQDVEFLRLEFLIMPNEAQLATMDIIKSYYRNNNRVKIKMSNSKKKKVIDKVKEQNSELEPYLFLLESGLSKYEKLAMYINMSEGYDCMTADEIKDILEDL